MVIGLLAKEMVMVFTNGSMVIFMKMNVYFMLFVPSNNNINIHESGSIIIKYVKKMI